MIVITTILFMLLVLLITVLFIPILFRINSEKSLVWLGIPNLIHLELKLKENEFIMLFAIPFKRKEIAIIDYLVSSAKTEAKRNHVKSKVTKKRSNTFIKKKLKKNWKNILQSFQVKQFQLDIDTDDFIVNAYLYPLFYWLRRFTKRPLEINFQGRSDVNIVIQNRLINLLVAALK